MICAAAANLACERHKADEGRQGRFEKTDKNAAHNHRNEKYSPLKPDEFIFMDSKRTLRGVVMGCLFHSPLF